MSDDNDDRRSGDRGAVGLIVRLSHPTVEAFVEKFATNLSPGGMFVQTRSPQAIDTPVRFEIHIAGGLPVMRGEAKVAWVREEGTAEGPQGMGLTFTRLDPHGQDLVARMLGKRGLRDPGPLEARDLDEPPPSATSAMVDVSLEDLKPDQGLAPSDDELHSLFDDVQMPPEEPAPEPDALAGIEAEPAGISSEAAYLLGQDEDDEKAPPELAAKPADWSVDLPDTPSDFTAESGEADEPALTPLDAVPPPPLPPADPPPPPPKARTAPRPAPSGLAPVPVSEPEFELSIDVDLSDGKDDDEIEIELGDLVENDAPPPVVFLEAPAEIPHTGPVIGIDLGTTNSCVAVFEDGRPRVIQSPEGYNTIPSVIALSKAERLMVGHPAKGQMLINPTRTVYGAKRLVGRPFESAVVREVKSHFHYPICGDTLGRAAVQLGEHLLSLEEVQGLILREARTMAEAHLKEPVHRAVVTVPAYYSDAQRQAVRTAGKLAGLHVERMLNEPTAAALAYGLNRELNRTVLIYDLGGGTFDATIMRISSNVFEVLATGGDTFLGGADFDTCVVEHLLAEFEATEGQAFEGDRVALSRVTDAAENAKIALSERTEVDVVVPYLMVDAEGVPHELRTKLTRAKLEDLHLGLVERTLDVVRDVFLDAGLLPAAVDDVILVGGQSRSPLVRASLEAFFGKPPHPGVHPDEAVGLGAALLAASLGKVDSVVLVDVLPMTLGVGLPGGRFHRIIERNTALPVRKTYGIGTTRDNQTLLEISVFQGEDEHVAGNEFLGTARLEDLPRGRAGAVRVAVTFELGPDCVLSLSAQEISTGATISSRLATRGTPDEVRSRLGADTQEAREAEQRRTEALPSSSGRLLSFFKRMVSRA